MQSTDVRWSAAKGLARIAERLQPDMAAQVLGAVMELPAQTEVCINIQVHATIAPRPSSYLENGTGGHTRNQLSWQCL